MSFPVSESAQNKTNMHIHLHGLSWVYYSALLSAPALSLLNILVWVRIHVLLSKETKEVQTVFVIKEISP